MDSRYAKLAVAVDIEITDATKGIILKASDGSRVRMTLGYTTDDVGNKIFNPVFTAI